MPEAPELGTRLYRHDTFPGQVDWHTDVLESWDEEAGEKEYHAYPVDQASALEDMLAAVAICAMSEARIAYDRWCAARPPTETTTSDRRADA